MRIRDALETQRNPEKPRETHGQWTPGRFCCMLLLNPPWLLHQWCFCPICFVESICWSNQSNFLRCLVEAHSLAVNHSEPPIFENLDIAIPSGYINVYVCLSEIPFKWARSTVKSPFSLIKFREITTFNDELPLFGWLMLVKFKCLVSSIKSPLSPCKIRNEAPCQSLGIGRSSQARINQGQGGSPEKLGISPGSERLIAWSKTLQEWPWNCCVFVGHVMFRWPSLLLSRKTQEFKS